MSKAAEASKDKGNLAFRQANYALALAHYTTSIQLDPSSYLYPLNRSLVHLKLNEWRQAEKDATVALELDPVEASKKAYYRRALARKGMAKYKLAIKDLEQAKEAGAQPKDIDQELNNINKLLQDSGAPTTQHELPLPPPPIPNKRPATPSELPKTPSSTSSVEEPTSEPPPPPPPAQPFGSSKSAAPSKDRLKAALAPRPTSSTKKEKESVPTLSFETKSTKPKPSGDLMTAVSTRSLTRPNAGAANGGSGKTTPSSFAAKKQERTSRFASSAPVKPSSKTAPNAVPPPPPAPATTAAPPAATEAVAPTPPLVESLPKPPTSTSTIPLVPHWTPIPPSKPIQLASPQPLPSTPSYKPHPSSSTFEQTLSSPSLTPSGRLTYLRSIPPATLPTLLKGGALTPDLLTLIIQALASSSIAETNIEPNVDDWLLNFVHHLAKVDRFDMNVMFLEEADRELVRGVFDRAERGLRISKERWGL
ncbi:hypothetical protein MVLG_01302 [Microbotryum lychnidis-dioicae p1A1 Lamole]|uniref:RNA polymerase II-associated protein 3 n=1 Tax=Microbotryum lychnidis-dioicae (strain p1A1 Lamole / MvSl-1064) TaxID=683840 RepID=U5H1P9_USTV1|nr:hypothetical protein MVLG_01302 [Microbotryum lychnidis-dioicae p1A1 Lamole]|eukprot:KDE08523.1 hypothetical protein MVLG_01302 [Microbotryum lychnidis-dioicae p1A1 Lamole]